jgi:hypothetical protein
MTLLQEAAILLQRYVDWHLHNEKTRPTDKETKDLIERIYMTESVALTCLDCDFTGIVKVAESQEELLKLIADLKSCGKCGGMRICQQAWRDDYGNKGTSEFSGHQY